MRRTVPAVRRQIPPIRSTDRFSLTPAGLAALKADPRTEKPVACPCNSNQPVKPGFKLCWDCMDCVAANGIDEQLYRA